jgi:hypothetical protein
MTSVSAGVHIFILLSLGVTQTMVIGAVMVSADWVVLASLWEAPKMLLNQSNALAYAVMSVR